MAEDTLNIYEKRAEEMTATNMITREDTFAKTKGGFLSLDCKGTHYDRVRITRLFPSISFSTELRKVDRILMS